MSKKMRKDFYVVGRSDLFALTDKIEDFWAIMVKDYQDMTGKKLEDRWFGEKSASVIARKTKLYYNSRCRIEKEGDCAC